MALSVYGEELFTSHFSGSPVFFQKFTITNNLALKAIRTWIVLFNNPTFTNLQLRIYSNIGGSPGQLIATADTTWTKAQLSATDDNGVLEPYFEFINTLSLRGGDTYHAVLWATGYTGDENSHVAWVRGVYDPPNSGFTPDVKYYAIAPFKIGLIGALL